VVNPSEDFEKNLLVILRGLMGMQEADQNALAGSDGDFIRQMGILSQNMMSDPQAYERGEYNSIREALHNVFTYLENTNSPDGTVANADAGALDNSMDGVLRMDWSEDGRYDSVLSRADLPQHDYDRTVAINAGVEAESLQLVQEDLLVLLKAHMEFEQNNPGAFDDVASGDFMAKTAILAQHMSTEPAMYEEGEYNTIRESMGRVFDHLSGAENADNIIANADLAHVDNSNPDEVRVIWSDGIQPDTVVSRSELPQLDYADAIAAASPEPTQPVQDDLLVLLKAHMEFEQNNPGAFDDVEPGDFMAKTAILAQHMSTEPAMYEEDEYNTIRESMGRVFDHLSGAENADNIIANADLAHVDNSNPDEVRVIWSDGIQPDTVVSRSELPQLDYVEAIAASAERHAAFDAVGLGGAQQQAQADQNIEDRDLTAADYNPAVSTVGFGLGR